MDMKRLHFDHFDITCKGAAGKPASFEKGLLVSYAWNLTGAVNCGRFCRIAQFQLHNIATWRRPPAWLPPPPFAAREALITIEATSAPVVDGIQKAAGV